MIFDAVARSRVQRAAGRSDEVSQACRKRRGGCRPGEGACCRRYRWMQRRLFMHTAELGKTPQAWPVVVGWGGIYFQSVTLLVGLAWEVEVGVVGGVYLVGGRWEWWELWE